MLMNLGLTQSNRAQHVVSRPSVMGLPGGQFERDRQAMCIGDGVDFRRQTAPRAPHADGSKVSHAGGVGGRFAPLFALAPCWWTRIEELSTDCSEPS